MSTRSLGRQMGVSAIGDKPVGPGSITSAVRLPLWVNPPDQWENLDISGYVALPAEAAQAVIVTFKVPQGRNGVIKKIANNLIGGGWVEGSGTINWQILVDGAPPPGASSYDSILDSLGAVPSPTEIAGFRIYENQTVEVVINNVSVVVAGQLAGARLIGYLYPREMEADSQWL
jgi:hypothetical protein